MASVHLGITTRRSVLPLPSEGERVGVRGPFARFWWYRQDAPSRASNRQKQKSALAQDVLGEERFAQSLTLRDLQFLFAD